MKNSKSVLEIASVVRSVLEKVTPELVRGIGNFPPFPFPGAWCQDTSRALGKLLCDRGEGGFELVFGKNPQDHRKTHVWLEREGLIVDITADQFEGSGTTSVMVTADRTWHDRWVQRRQELDDVLVGHADYMIYWTVVEHPEWNGVGRANDVS